MLTSLDMDDYNAWFCGEERYPLLNDINRQLIAPLPPRPSPVKRIVTPLSATTNTPPTTKLTPPPATIGTTVPLSPSKLLTPPPTTVETTVIVTAQTTTPVATTTRRYSTPSTTTPITTTTPKQKSQIPTDSNRISMQSQSTTTSITTTTPKQKTQIPTDSNRISMQSHSTTTLATIHKPTTTKATVMAKSTVLPPIFQSIIFAPRGEVMIQKAIQIETPKPPTEPISVKLPSRPKKVPISTPPFALKKLHGVSDIRMTDHVKPNPAQQKLNLELRKRQEFEERIKRLPKHSLINNILTLLSGQRLTAGDISHVRVLVNKDPSHPHDSVESVIPAVVFESSNSDANHGPRIMIPVITQQENKNPSFSGHLWNTFDRNKPVEKKNLFETNVQGITKDVGNTILKQTLNTATETKEPKVLKPVPFKLPSKEEAKPMVQFIDIEDFGYFF